MKDNHFLLKNIGFSENFFESLNDNIYVIRQSAFRKIYSDSAVKQIPKEESIQRRCKEAEDKELYQEDESEYIPMALEEEEKSNAMKGVSNCFEEDDSDFVKTMGYSNDQMAHLNQLLFQMNSSFEDKQVIKAYKSRHKSKFYKIYELNSVINKEKNKFRLFHKCNYPHCGRTFASAGWLKSHFADHLKVVSNHRFNVLFDKYIKRKRISASN